MSKRGLSGAVPPASNRAGQSPVLSTPLPTEPFPPTGGAPSGPSSSTSEAPITVSPGGWIHYNESVIGSVPTQFKQTLTLSGKSLSDGGCSFSGPAAVPAGTAEVVEEETAYNPATCEAVVVRAGLTSTELDQLEASPSLSQSPIDTVPATSAATSLAAAPTSRATSTPQSRVAQPMTSETHYKSGHTKTIWVDPLDINITSLIADLSWPLNGAAGPTNTKVYSYEFEWDDWKNTGQKGPYLKEEFGAYPGEITIGEPGESWGWSASAHETFYNADFAGLIKAVSPLGFSLACEETNKETEFSHNIKVMGYANSTMGYWYSDSKKGACSNLVHHVTYAGWGWDGPEHEKVNAEGIAIIASHEYEGEAEEGSTTSATLPAVSTLEATPLSEGEVALHGTVNPEHLSTKYHFDYGTSETYGLSTTEVGAGSGTSPVTAGITLTGLQPGAIYHYRIVATNSAGTSYGSDQTFRVPERPTITSEADGEVQETSANLSASVDPNELETHYFFQYGLTTSYGSSEPAEPGANIGGGSSFVPCSARITHLEPGTTYHFRIIASNSAGTRYGNDETFMTPSPASMAIDKENNRWVAIEGPNHTLDIYWQSQKTGEWAGPDPIGGPGTTYSAPSIAIDKENNRWIAAEGPNHTLDIYWQNVKTGEWAGPGQIAGPGSTYAAPSLAIDNENNRWIAVQGPNNSLSIVWQNVKTGEWAGPGQIAGSGSTYAAPSLAIDKENDRWIAVQGPNNSLSIVWQNVKTGEWAGPGQIAGSGSTYAAPSLAIDKENDRWIAIQGPNNSLSIVWQNVKTGEWAGPGQIAGPGSTYAAPSLAIDNENNRWIAVQGPNNSLSIVWQNVKTGEWAGPGQIGAPGTTHSAPSVAIDSENNRWIASGGGGSGLSVYWQSQKTAEWTGPLSPEGVLTRAATAVTEEQATFGGYVDPKGIDTHYYYQYGETTAYGSTTPSPPGNDAGSGEGFISATATTVKGLQPGMTYHYRLVATSAAGTSYGADEGFTTHAAPSIAIDKENNRWMAIQGPSHTLDVFEQVQSTGKWIGPVQIAGPGTTYAAPSLAIDGENNRWIAAEGPSRTLDIYWQSQKTGEWAGPGEIAGPGSTYAAPSLAIDNENNRWIAIQGPNNSLSIVWQNVKTGEWAGPGQIAGSGSTYAAPSLAIDKENNRWIAVQGPNNSLSIVWQNVKTGEWAGPGQIAGSGSTYAAPSLAIDNENNRWIAVQGPNNSLSIVWQNVKTGEWAGPGQIGAGGLPNATTEPVTALNATTATLNGSVDPLGVSTTYHFEYGPTTTYGTSLPTGGASVGSGENTISESVNLSGLKAATLYHYRIVATNSLGTTYGVDRVFTTSTWATEYTPDATGAANNRLTGVSCTSTTACAATAYELYNGASYAYGEFWNGSTWTIHSMNANGGMQLNGISCTSSTSCTAVGDVTESNGNVVTVAEYWNGTEWKRQSTPNATGAANNRLTGVSCTSTTACAATAYELYNGASYAYGEFWNGSTWTIHSMNENGGMQLNGISCTSSTSCTAVGDVTESNGNVVTVAEYWNGTEWKRQSTPNATGAANNRLTGVSCTSTTACAATAYELYNGASYAYGEFWNGSTWTIHSMNENGGMQLNGISCTSSTSCRAVGDVTETSGNVITSVEYWNGTEWNLEFSPNESGATNNQLTGVSCATVCTVVGSYTNGNGVWNLAERY